VIRVIFFALGRRDRSEREEKRIGDPHCPADASVGKGLIDGIARKPRHGMRIGRRKKGEKRLFFPPSAQWGRRKGKGRIDAHTHLPALLGIPLKEEKRGSKNNTTY